MGIALVGISFQLVRISNDKISATREGVIQSKPFSSLESAKDELERLLSAGELVLEDVVGSSDSLNALGATTRAFFERYPSIRTRRGGFQVSRAAVSASTYLPGYISIGHIEDWDLVQQAGRDETFIVDGSEIKQAEMECFPTIYHLVVSEGAPNGDS